MTRLKWIICNPLESTNSVREKSNLHADSVGAFLVEVGPRLNFSTPFSSNAVSISHSVGLKQVKRFERSTRYCVQTTGVDRKQLLDFKQKFCDSLYDRMTCCEYKSRITRFDHDITPKPWYVVDILKYGKEALEEINNKLGLSFDEWDFNFYTELFSKTLKRNPTSVECFDLAQSNSEHSRHWFFKGILNIEGVDAPCTLFDMIKDTQNYSNRNNVIKFSDNSSAIEGCSVQTIKPQKTMEPSSFCSVPIKYDPIFTAETHNFPTAICPFSGAATGAGGRIRDIQAAGRGGNTIAGTAGYSVGNLLIEGYEQPWEEKSAQYSATFASPLTILVEGSDGCSTYGNKFGEPLVCGFTRSFGIGLGHNDRREYIKPILFSGGVGIIDDEYKNKAYPLKGMRVIKIGGPAYRIGVGGGSASSTEVQGDNSAELDFNAVQREDPEMEQRLSRLIRACVEMDHRKNPVSSIHDQGAGGNGNVLKELVEPAGAVIYTQGFELGDRSLSTLELWGAEYQENNAVLCSADDVPLLLSIGRRERCPVNVVGTVTGNGRIILTEEDMSPHNLSLVSSESKKRFPVDLDLKSVLGDVPQKVFKLTIQPLLTDELHLPICLKLWDALNRVLRHPTVCSKRFLTNKVDRSVTGLIAQQQCVGPIHTPVADAAVTAMSYLEKSGIATSIGEQPIKGLINPAAGARMTVAEALSNLVFVPISALRDVKCSGNWMWPAKLPGEGVKLYETCRAMCDIMKTLGIAIDGGKDSLSMATRVIDSHIVKSPGTLVISTYVLCEDITALVTPDLKTPRIGVKGLLLYFDSSNGKCRLGGSILAQCYKQLGNNAPDVDNAKHLQLAFQVTQKLIREGKIYAGHDVSDGGLITCLLEMAFAGICGLEIFLGEKSCGCDKTPAEILFAEECGWVMEVADDDSSYVMKCFNDAGLMVTTLGYCGKFGMDSLVVVNRGSQCIIEAKLCTLFSMWEETSYEIEKLQRNNSCAQMEYETLSHRKGPSYCCKILPSPPNRKVPSVIKVAVLREEGTNGDREMITALYLAGFETWDVTMQDLLDRNITLDKFRGIVFPGGFSYADVLGAAKGWAATVLFNVDIRNQFNSFFNRRDTFSLGVCNGCQLMCLINWIGLAGETYAGCRPPQVVLKENISGKFESRFSAVRIFNSPAIMLHGMEDSCLGVWVAHGEGRFTYASQEVEKKLNENNCIAIRYVDDDNKLTEAYPFNPNGSSGGAAGICSPDGRHLAMMPHPERCIQFWQWPYVPEQWKHESYSPWFQMFINAYNWCCTNV